MRSFARFALFVSILLVLTLTGSAQQTIQPIGSADPNQTVQFNVFMPLQNGSQLDQLLEAIQNTSFGSYRKWIAPQDFTARFGPKASDLAAIQAELATYGLTVIQTHAHGMLVQGKVSGVQKAFGVTLMKGAASAGVSKVITQQPLKLPSSLVQANAHVAAFSPAIRHRTHSRVLGAAPANRYSSTGPYWFDDLKQAYSYPSFQVLNGTGRTIGIVMSNDFLDSDMQLYFGHEKINPPRIIRVPVDGGAPFDPNLSFEISLDIQQAGGMAPGATIVHYNIPDLSDNSILDAYTKVVEDNLVDVVNSSFGGAEAFYTAAYNNGVDYTWILQLYEDIFKQGNAQGIAFIASSGDNGGLGLPSVSYFSPPQPTQFLPGIESPAASPRVTAVGGTNLVTTYVPPSLQSQYVRENAYGDPLLPYDPYGIGNLISGGVWGSGGGVSVIFSKPLYQYLVNTGANMRSIPDVSLHMGGCPVGQVAPNCAPDRSSVVAAVGGAFYLLIGTSCSSADFAGTLALAEQNLGGLRLGNANYYIYAMAALQSLGLYQSFHQGIPGNNGYFTSQSGSRGYNLVLGNGTLIVRNFILAPNAPLAGNPQTPSNP